MKVIQTKESKDNISKKYIQLTDDNYLIETAFINDKTNYKICFSSQVGCPIGCIFCYNGLNKKFYRNLTANEMYEQCENVIIDNTIKEKEILFGCMGVGEPLLNYKNVIEVINKLHLRYPDSRFAIATVVNNVRIFEKTIRKISKNCNLKIIISLHASNDVLRKKLIPINKNLEKTIKLIKRIRDKYNIKVEWNYVLLDKINDSNENAIELSKILGENELIKITKYNEIVGLNFRSSSNYEMFCDLLKKEKLVVEEFEAKGKDIECACGQMSSNKKEIN